MSSKKLRLIGTVFIIAILWFLLAIVSNAASFSASISDTSVEVGDTFKVTVTADNAAGMYSVSASNSNVSVSSGSTSEFLEDGSTTVTYKANKAGTVSITATASDMTDLDDDTKAVTGSRKFTVTVKAKSTSSSGSSGGSSGNSSTPKTTTPSFSSVNETVYATGSVNVRSSYSTSSSIVGSLDAGDSVTRTGRGSNGWSRVTYNGQTAYISSEYLTTEKPEESDNNNLESLSISGYELTPKFSADVKEYSLTITENVEKLDITAEPEDENAEVKIEGNENLLIGENTIKIIVTAEDGTERTYTLNVTKGETPPVGLSELSIAGYKLTPEFSSDVYEYTLDISDTSVTSVDITAKSDTEDAIIEIVGNNDLKLGENVITVLVKSENEEQTSTYQITVNIAEPVPDAPAQIIPGLDNTDLYIYIGCGVVVLIVLIIIIVVAVKHKRNKEDEYVDYYGGLDFSDDSEKNKKSKSKKKKEDSPIEEDIQTNQEENIKVEETIGAGMNDNYMQNFDDEDKPRRRGKHF